VAGGSPRKAQPAPWGMKEGKGMDRQPIFAVLLIGLDHRHTGSGMCIAPGGVGPSVPRSKTEHSFRLSYPDGLA